MAIFRNSSWGLRRTQAVTVALMVVLVGDLLALAVVDASSTRTPSTAASSAKSAPADANHMGNAGDRSAEGDKGGTATTGAPGSPSGSPESGAESAESERLEDLGWDFGVRLSATCVKVASTVTLTVELEPDSGAAFAVFYADGNTYGTQRVGQSDPAGRMVHQWVVPTAVGEAMVVVMAGNASRTKSGRKTRYFRVVGPGEKC